jgi:hypothetical protein
MILRRSLALPVLGLFAACAAPPPTAERAAQATVPAALADC